jgi:hypothetical protein
MLPTALRFVGKLMAVLMPPRGIGIIVLVIELLLLTGLFLSDLGGVFGHR